MEEDNEFDFISYCLSADRHLEKIKYCLEKDNALFEKFPHVIPNAVLRNQNKFVNWAIDHKNVSLNEDALDSALISNNTGMIKRLIDLGIGFKGNRTKLYMEVAILNNNVFVADHLVKNKFVSDKRIVLLALDHECYDILYSLLKASPELESVVSDERVKKYILLRKRAEIRAVNKIYFWWLKILCGNADFARRQALLSWNNLKAELNSELLV